MIQAEMILRTLLRKSGLARPIVRMLGRDAERRRANLREEYQLTRPAEATVSVLGKSARMSVRSAEEYAHYLAEPESRIMGIVFQNVGPGDTVWDIGANVGLYTLLIGAAVGPTGVVLGFEPMPSCFERLSENVALNAATHVRPVHLALGRRSERLFVMQCSSGLEGDIRVVTEAPPGTPSVEVVPGDQWRAQQGLPVPKLIKIDVQAAEEDVLIGLEQTIRDPACKVIICEIHYAIFATRNDANAPLRIEQHLKSCGFSRIERLDRNHIGAWKV